MESDETMWALFGRGVSTEVLGSLPLERKFHFGPTEVRVVDRVVSTSLRALTRAQLVGEFTSIHMGSTRYLHPSEPQGEPTPIR